jgi:hypothetical protein
MTKELVEKIIIIAIYLFILILIPIFLDYLFRITIRNKRKTKIKSLAMKKAVEKNKSVVIFNNVNNGIVIHSIGNKNESSEEFTGSFTEIINNMADDSCVVVVLHTLEYLDELPSVLTQLQKISGGDLYLLSMGKNSPRVFWDYKIRNILDKSFYLPTDKEIKWSSPNTLQLKLHKFYSLIFKILPYDSFTNDKFNITK